LIQELFQQHLEAAEAQEVRHWERCDLEAMIIMLHHLLYSGGKAHLTLNTENPEKEIEEIRCIIKLLQVLIIHTQSHHLKVNQAVKTSTDIVIHVHLNLSLHPAPVMRTLWQRPIPCGLCQPLVLGPPVPGAHRAWVCP
jgi:hypothetical protein